VFFCGCWLFAGGGFSAKPLCSSAAVGGGLGGWWGGLGLLGVFQQKNPLFRLAPLSPEMKVAVEVATRAETIAHQWGPPRLCFVFLGDFFPFPPPENKKWPFFFFFFFGLFYGRRGLSGGCRPPRSPWW